MNQIIVKRASDGFTAHFESNPAKWESGKSPNEAIGKLIVSYQRELNIEVEEK